jgi:hypothetical protein
MRRAHSANAESSCHFQSVPLPTTERSMSDLAALTHHDLTPHEGSTFELTADDALAVSLELSEVKTRGQASNTEDGGRQAFSLL